MKLRRPVVAVIAVVVLSACANDQDRVAAAGSTGSSPVAALAGAGDVGVAHPYQLYAHCTPTYADFGGRTWKVEQPVVDPPGEPFARGAVDYLPGTMELVAVDRLRFTVDDSSSVVPGAVITFRPTAETPPLCH